ncbi:Bidirectional sugar transporter SWEET4 [Platanthera zijinensis]|uniref:Bidirectional sugar transporter SWEET n=1 Tax=Platanthera zijinensis TaxID=2320716 RepID=A0AAP0BGZ6_9ASPA
MVSADNIRTGVGIVGNIISFGLFLSPAPTFKRILKNKSVEQFSVIPYVATLLNCMLWVLYGMPFVKPNSTLVVSINGVGVVIELIYVIIFLLYSGGARRNKAILLLVADFAFVAAVASLVLSLYKTHERRTLIVGILCIIFCIIMYISPLCVMRKVIRTKSVEFMPIYLSLLSFFNGLCWTIYALIHFDVNIMIPNGLGFIFAVAQLILYAIYYKSTKRQLMERNGQVGLSTSGLSSGRNTSPTLSI